MDPAALPARLELKASIANLGEEVRIEARLRNTSNAPLWVNTRLLFNTAHAPAPFRELWLDVKSPTGGALPFRCKVRAGAPTTAHYALVEPGRSVSRVFALNRCFDLGAKGRYRITAHYRDGNVDPPAPPEGAPHLGAELRSEPIEIVME